MLVTSFLRQLVTESAEHKFTFNWGQADQKADIYRPVDIGRYFDQKSIFDKNVTVFRR